MALYIFKHPEKEEYIEVVQSMSEPHIYRDDNGLEWIREWTIPAACVNGKWDAWSRKGFAENVAKRKGTYGDIEQKSKELSEERAAKLGSDPVKEKYLSDYEKKVGKPHLERAKEAGKKTFEI